MSTLNKYLFFAVIITQGLSIPFPWPHQFCTSLPLPSTLATHSHGHTLPCSTTAPSPHTFLGWRTFLFLLRHFSLWRPHHRIYHAGLQIINCLYLNASHADPQGMGFEGVSLNYTHLCLYRYYCVLLQLAPGHLLGAPPPQELPFTLPEVTILRPHHLLSFFPPNLLWRWLRLQKHKENEAVSCEHLNFDFFLFPPTL